MCPDVSGIISNILDRVFDPNASIYSSGQVNRLVFAHLTNLNGVMGSCFSGVASEGCISPSISGTVYQGVLELMVAKSLMNGRIQSLAGSYTLTSFKEGDSTVTVADGAKNLLDLYKLISAEYDKSVKDAKYTLASSAPSTVIGVDAVVDSPPKRIFPYDGTLPI